MAENGFYRKDDNRKRPKQLKVFLGGLPVNWNEPTLEEFMNKFCRVISVTIHRNPDGKSKGFGFALIYAWNLDAVYGRHTVARGFGDEPDQYVEVKPIKSRPVYLTFHEHCQISDTAIHQRFFELGHPLAKIEAVDTSRSQFPTVMRRLIFDRESSSKEIVALRVISINGWEGHLSGNQPDSVFESPRMYQNQHHHQGQHYKGKPNHHQPNGVSPKHSPMDVGGAQHYGGPHMSHMGAGTHSGKKPFHSNSDTFEEAPREFDAEGFGELRESPTHFKRMESEEAVTETDFSEKSSLPRAVRKLSYSRNKGQEFYPTEVGMGTAEPPKEAMDQSFLPNSPQMLQSMPQTNLFPMTGGVAWSHTPTVAGAFAPFQALLGGYPGFQTGLQVQSYPLPSEPVKSKECIIPYYTFPFRE